MGGNAPQPKEPNMRVMVMIMGNAASESGNAPSEELLAAMTAYNEELVKAGIMTGGEGLHPSSRGKRVRFAGDKRTVVDGPFSETKELLAGFWLWNVKSMEEAVEWVKRVPSVGAPAGETYEIEIRPLHENEDFGEAMTPELLAREERMRVEIERQKR
jgi:hypothetical protein